MTFPNTDADGTHHYAVDIRPSQLDIFGHVNNAKYLEIFEEARWELLEERGFGLALIRELGLGPVILEAKIAFRRELKARDKCEVQSRITSDSGKIFVMNQKLVHKASNATAAEADFTAALFDLNNRKIVAPTAQWLKVLGLDLRTN